MRFSKKESIISEQAALEQFTRGVWNARAAREQIAQCIQLANLSQAGAFARYAHTPIFYE